MNDLETKSKVNLLLVCIPLIANYMKNSEVQNDPKMLYYYRFVELIRQGRYSVVGRLIHKHEEISHDIQLTFQT